MSCLPVSAARCLLLLLATSGSLVGSARSLAAAPKTARAAITSTISEDIAFLLAGLVVDTTLRPGVNAIETYVAAFRWRKNPPEINALFNAKVGYNGKIRGQTVLLGSDGTNNIIAVMIRDGFNAARVRAALEQAFTLRDVDSEESAGQKSDAYSLSDHGKDLGVVLLTYGVADAIRGSGTVAYMSAKEFNNARGH